MYHSSRLQCIQAIWYRWSAQQIEKSETRTCSVLHLVLVSKSSETILFSSLDFINSLSAEADQQYQIAWWNLYVLQTIHVLCILFWACWFQFDRMIWGYFMYLPVWVRVVTKRTTKTSTVAKRQLLKLLKSECVCVRERAKEKAWFMEIADSWC